LTEQPRIRDPRLDDELQKMSLNGMTG